MADACTSLASIEDSIARLNSLMSVFSLTFEGLEDEGYSIACNKSLQEIDRDDALNFVARYPTYHDALGVVICGINAEIDKITAAESAAFDAMISQRHADERAEQNAQG